MLLGIVLGLLAFVLAPEKERWTASVYIFKPSSYVLYQDIDMTARGAASEDLNSNRRINDEVLYARVADDLFKSALAMMISKGAAPKAILSSANGSGVYVVSSVSATKESSMSMLEELVKEANSSAISLNVPGYSGGKELRSFNRTAGVSVSVVNYAKSYLIVGAVLGLMFGGAIVFFRYLVQERKTWVRV